MESREVGLLIIVLGAAAIVVGLLVLAGGLSWFGRLPGDIRYESDGTRIFVPITSMILISIVLSLALAIARRFL